MEFFFVIAITSIKKDWSAFYPGDVQPKLSCPNQTTSEDENKLDAEDHYIRSCTFKYFKTTVLNFVTRDDKHKMLVEDSKFSSNSPGDTLIYFYNSGSFVLHKCCVAKTLLNNYISSVTRILTSAGNLDLLNRINLSSFNQNDKLYKSSTQCYHNGNIHFFNFNISSCYEDSRACFSLDSYALLEYSHFCDTISAQSQALLFRAQGIVNNCNIVNNTFVNNKLSYPMMTLNGDNYDFIKCIIKCKNENDIVYVNNGQISFNECQIFGKAEGKVYNSINASTYGYMFDFCPTDEPELIDFDDYTGSPGPNMIYGKIVMKYHMLY